MLLLYYHATVPLGCTYQTVDQNMPWDSLLLRQCVTYSGRHRGLCFLSSSPGGQEKPSPILASRRTLVCQFLPGRYTCHVISKYTELYLERVPLSRVGPNAPTVRCIGDVGVRFDSDPLLIFDCLLDMSYPAYFGFWCEVDEGICSRCLRAFMTGARDKPNFLLPEGNRALWPKEFPIVSLLRFPSRQDILPYPPMMSLGRFRVSRMMP